MTFTRAAERASCRGLQLWGWCLLASLIACDGTPTEPPPEAITLNADIDVAMNTVTLYGRVISRESTAETWFEWGTSPESLRYQTTIRMVSNTEAQVSNAAIDSLEPATTYYYRFVARTRSGTHHGETLSFVTRAQAPEAITSHAYVNAAVSTATLYGRVVPGEAPAETWFEWGTSAEALRYQSAIRMVSNTRAQVSNVAIGSLELATAYYYRFVARNSVGTHHGETLSFVTPASLPPPGGIGATLAFVRRGDIYIYTPTNDSTVRLTSGGNFGHPTWSPDGNRIAFAVDPHSAWPSSGIYVINADGSGLQRVGDGWSPAWSPEGRRLAFATLQHGQGAIFVTSVDDPTQPVIRIGFDRGQHDAPAWSPDGTRIAFISDRAAFDFAYDVYIANADGSGMVEQLTKGFGNQTWKIYGQPSWSPDGRSLAVVECDEWQFFYCADSRVGVMSAGGTGFRVLTYTTGFARPGWTPDGSAIAFSRTCWYHDCPSAIFEVALDGTNVRLLLEDAHSGVFRP